MPLMLTLHTN